MIEITQGSEEMLPFVKAEITPGSWQFHWWYEINVYNPVEKCWEHHYRKDGGAWFFWNVMKKAHSKVVEVWEEEYDLTS